VAIRINNPFKANKKRSGGLVRYAATIVIIGVIGSMAWTAFDKFIQYGRADVKESRANKIIRDVKEENFRQCLRDASGQVGVASKAQMDKCKQKYLDE